MEEAKVWTLRLSLFADNEESAKFSNRAGSCEKKNYLWYLEWDFIRKYRKRQTERFNIADTRQIAHNITELKGECE